MLFRNLFFYIKLKKNVFEIIFDQMVKTSFYKINRRICQPDLEAKDTISSV